MVNTCSNEFINDLKWRGLLYQVTNEELLQKCLDKGTKVYCGVDPTASSLHIGHIVPFITLKRFLNAGHKAVVLVGGATGMIGDPSGRSEERNLLSEDVINNNVLNLKSQLKNLINNDSIEFVNNRDWIDSLSLIDFLRDYGKLININYMLNKESVNSRLDNGLSFTEFTYTLIQGIDFKHLNEHFGVEIQLGGSDQWGNITTGLEMMRKLNNEDAPDALGLTIPLVKKSDGSKFGKTAGGSIWLSNELTSEYDFYQFWINVSDDDVIDYLKIFTFLSKNEIIAIENEFNKDKGQRLAQTVLAEEMVKLIHGNEALKRVNIMLDLLVKGKLLNITESDYLSIENNLDVIEITEDKLSNIVDLLVESGVVESRRRSREDIKNGAVKVNGNKILDDSFIINKELSLFNNTSILLLEKGKKIKKFIRII